MNLKIETRVEKISLLLFFIALQPLLSDLIENCADNFHPHFFLVATNYHVVVQNFLVAFPILKLNDGQHINFYSRPHTISHSVFFLFYVSAIIAMEKSV